MNASGRARPQQALLEQSRTVCWDGYRTCRPRPSNARPCCRAGLCGSSPVTSFSSIPASCVRLDQPTKQAALPIHEFVTRYRRDVEMIMAATLEASDGLTGPEVVTRLESAIDDLASQTRRRVSGCRR